MFQHRHYVMLAETIAKRLNVTDKVREHIAEEFADALRGSNPNYDRSRFIAAATGKPINGRDKSR